MYGEDGAGGAVVACVVSSSAFDVEQFFSGSILKVCVVLLAHWH